MFFSAVFERERESSKQPSSLHLWDIHLLGFSRSHELQVATLWDLDFTSLMIADVQHLSVCSLATCRTLFRMCWLVRFTHLMLDSQYSCGELKGFECVLHKPSGRFVDQGYFLFLCALYVCFLDSFFTYSVFVILFVCFWNWVLGRSGCLELFMQPKVTLISWEAPTSQVLQLQGWTTRESLTVSSEKFLIWTMLRLSSYKKNFKNEKVAS